DRLGLPALLGAGAGIGTRRVDERDDRLAEFFRELHEPERLAIPLGMRHPEVPRDLLARVASLLVADHDDAAPLEERKAADHRRVVAVHAIAVQLDEVVEEELDEVARVRALRVARELRALPGRQRRIGTLPLALEPFFQLADLIGPGGV